jgi:hypothetical protein
MFAQKLSTATLKCFPRRFLSPLEQRIETLVLHRILNLGTDEDFFFDFGFSDLWKFPLQIWKAFQSWSITLRHVSESFLPWKSNRYYILYVCARACMQPCWSSMQRVGAILWRRLWPLWLHHIFRHYLINGTIFEKKFLGLKCVFYFPYSFYLNFFSFWIEFSEILP